MRYKEIFLHSILTILLLSGCATTFQKADPIPTKFDSAALPLQFQEVLARYSPEAFNKCYKPYLRKFKKGGKTKPRKGKLEYKITFDNLGAVQKVVRTRKSKLPKQVSQCVYKGLKKLDFGKSEYAKFEIIYPLILKYR